jgi:hypothetical protein
MVEERTMTLGQLFREMEEESGTKLENTFDCKDCGVNTSKIGEYYMIHTDLWKQVNQGVDDTGMLCLGCVEERLGRKLNRRDFPAIPLNDPTREIPAAVMKLRKALGTENAKDAEFSERFLDRLGRE